MFSAVTYWSCHVFGRCHMFGSYCIFESCHMLRVSFFKILYAFREMLHSRRSWHVQRDFTQSEVILCPGLLYVQILSHVQGYYLSGSWCMFKTTWYIGHAGQIWLQSRSIVKLLLMQRLLDCIITFHAEIPWLSKHISCRHCLHRFSQAADVIPIYVDSKVQSIHTEIVYTDSVVPLPQTGNIVPWCEKP